MTKKALLEQLKRLIDLRIEHALAAIASARESRDSDTKSSAGDKHETGRAMMQIEMENNEVQLKKALELKSELDKLNVAETKSQISFGSLVQTNEGNYFISIGIGKLTLDGETYYAISLASPLGVVLKGKTVGDKILFQKRYLVINNIC